MRSTTFALLAAATLSGGCALFHHDSGSSGTPAPAPAVQPWPGYADLAGGAGRGGGWEYCWAWEDDPEAIARQAREAGINFTIIGLCSCAEKPDAIQVYDRTYWVRNLGDALNRAERWISAMRKYRIWTVIAVANDCGFNEANVSPEAYRDVVLPRLRAIGTEGVAVYPVVEAQNRNAMPWAIYHQLTEQGWTGLRLWCGAGGGGTVSPPGWLLHAHPPDFGWFPTAPAVLSNDSPVNGKLMASGYSISPVTGYEEFYVKRLVSKSVGVQSQLSAYFTPMAQRGFSIAFWQAHFKPGQTDWASMRLVGSLQRGVQAQVVLRGF